MNEHLKPIANNLIKTVDLPLDLCFGMPILSFTGNQELYISNHRGILSFAPEEIVILANNYQLVVKGRNLFISSFNQDELQIKGYILSVGFV